MRNNIPLILLSTLLASCASAPEQPQSLRTDPTLRSDQTFNAPKSAVWPLVVADVGLDYPIRSSDVESGLLLTDTVLLPVGNWNINKAIRRWVLSPGGNILIGYSALRVALNVLVTETEAAKTHVVIRARYEAFQGPLGSPNGTWVGERSNGGLEQEILNRIADRLAKTQ